MSSKEEFLTNLKEKEKEMNERAKPENPYVSLGNLKQQGYNLRKILEQKYLFNQPGPFGLESGFMPEGIVSLLVSPGGCGKTYALMQCAVAGATGTKWFDYYQPTSRFKTLLILAEEGRVFAHNRMRHIVHGLGLIDNQELMEQVYSNIHMLPMSGQMQRLINSQGEITENYLYLKNYLENNPEIKLVILDPASRFLGPQCELDNAAATDWVSALSLLTQIKSKPTIVASHHANKSAIRPINGSKDAVFDQSITRGASGLVDGVRLVLGMQRKEQDKICSIIFKIFKTNVCDVGEAVELEIDRKNGGILMPKSTSKEAHGYYTSKSNNKSSNSDAREVGV